MAGEQQQEGKSGKPDFSVEGEDEVLASGGASGDVEGEGEGAADGEQAPDKGAKQGKAAPASDDDGPKVPLSRFREVNDKYAETLQENARLKGELEGVRSVAVPKAPEKEAPAPVDIKDLRKRAADALMEANTELYAELTAQADAELERRADERADAKAAKARAEAVAEFQAQTQAQQAASMQATAAKMAQQFPFLDSAGDEADEVAIAACVAERNKLMRAGTPGPQALEQAAKTIARRWGIEVKEGEETPGEKRQREALDRAADTSNRQPPRLVAGRGERSGIAAVDPKNMTEAQVKEVAADKRKMLSGDFGT